MFTRETSSFEASGERERRLDLLVELQELAAGARVQPLGPALRGAQRSRPEPVRQRASRARQRPPEFGRVAHELWRALARSGRALPDWLGARALRAAQRGAERLHSRARRELLKFDEQIETT